MPERTVHLTDDQKQQLEEIAEIEGRSLDECIKALALDRIRDRVRVGRRAKAPTFELPKRAMGRTNK